MLSLLNYIVWDPSFEAFRLGPIAVRWYSLCWLVGLVGAYFMVKWLYKDQKLSEEKFEPLFIYCFVGILVGARLGHCIFYQPDYFLTSGKGFVEMFLPIHFLADGGWRFTGFEGLASHGGTIGLMLAICLYCCRLKMPVWQVLDNIAIATPITACFIRIGNLMNSEIIGKITDVPWAFIFERVDQMPLHPGQLYEAMSYFCFFFVGMYFYKIKKLQVGRGFYFGLCIFLIFTFRFFIEYTKVEQVDFEQGMLFNMGQLLSVPFVLLGAYCMYNGLKKK